MIWFRFAAAAAMDALAVLTWPAQAIGRWLDDDGDES